MCGINGIIRFDGKDIVNARIKKMNDKIKHRGPDGEGIFLKNNVGLGHRRLAILDLRSKGNQPMVYEHKGRKLIITYNGEIYNFLELKNILLKKKYKFETKTDTEVVLASYLEWGEKCVQKFNGMWAFAIYDLEKNKIFCSRDRFGIKPFHYYCDNKQFIFSSEIKGLLVNNIEKKVNMRVASKYLWLKVLNDSKETFFDSIYRLLPGHNLCLFLDTNKFKIRRYYDLTKMIKKNSPSKFSVRAELAKSIRKRLVSDVPIGSCLSGGIDSSSIVSIMRKINPSSIIKSYSLVFPGCALDEKKYQDLIISECSLANYKTTFTIEDVVKDIDKLIKIQEEPFPGFSVYGQYKIMRLAKQKNQKVILDGQGSDEIFLGYMDFYKLYLKHLLLSFQFSTFLKEILYIIRERKIMHLVELLKLFMPDSLRKIMFKKRFVWLKLKLKDSVINNYIYNSKCLQRYVVTRYLKWTLPNLLRYEDLNSMANSIEARVPFCDHNFVEKSFLIPYSKMISRGITKNILREEVSDLLPNEILSRKDKLGFTSPDSDLIKSKEGYSFFEKVINSVRFKNRPYWDAMIISDYLQEHKSGIKNHSSILTKVVIFELWLRCWIDSS